MSPNHAPKGEVLPTMASNKTSNLRKGTVVSLLTIALATTVGAYGTFAYFSDTESSTSNLFAAGTLDLELSTAESGGIDAFVEAGNFAPGDAESGTLTLENTGSIYDGDAEGHSVDLSIDTTVTQTDADETSTDMAKYLEVTVFSYDSTSLVGSVTDANGNGYVDLEDLGAHSFTGLADPGSAGKNLDVEVSFHTSAGNDLQGDSVNVQWDFTLQQS